MRRMLFKVLGAYRRYRLWRLERRGQTPDDVAAQRIVTGRSWDEFCDALKAAGAALQHGSAPTDPQSQAEGHRYLARLARAGLEAFVEHGDPRAPVLRRLVHETVKMGADNPDNDYRNAPLDPAHTYVIRGQRGTVSQLSFATQAGGFGGGEKRLTGHLDAADLELDPDGGFQLTLSRDRAEGNWLPMAEDTALLLVRQTFGDRRAETPATMDIECVGAGPPGSASPARIDEGLASASVLVAGASMMFSRWSSQFKARPNTLPRFDQATSDAAGGDPNIAYYHGYWELPPGKALVIEVRPPACRYWNFQLNDYWLQSLDYAHHRISLNMRDAKPEPNGLVRIVVAHEDPEHANWLSTTGQPFGTMSLRWGHADRHPDPEVRLVDLAEVRP